MAKLSVADKKILLDNLHPFSLQVMNRLNHADIKLDKLVFMLRPAAQPVAINDNNATLPLNVWTNTLLDQIGLPNLELKSFSVAVVAAAPCPGGKYVCNGLVCKWVCP